MLTALTCTEFGPGHAGHGGKIAIAQERWMNIQRRGQGFFRVGVPLLLFVGGGFVGLVSILEGKNTVKVASVDSEQPCNCTSRSVMFLIDHSVARRQQEKELLQ